MGVQGLLGTCLRNEDACCETADLIEMARQRQGIEILVDFNAFKYYILDVLFTKNSSLRENVYFTIQGGEYKSLGLYVKRFVEVLKDKEINLVFYVDGCKGSSRAGLDPKVDTWIARSTLNASQLTEILDVCRGKVDVERLSKHKKILPLNLVIELMEALRTCHCEIHYIAVGEADMVIAKALKYRHAFAVFTNDSDFCVMKHGRMIPFQLFDIDKDLKLDEPMELPSSLRKLKVKVITTDKVISMFQFEDHSQLVEMSIVAGNDYTGPFMRDHLTQQLGIRKWICIDSFADWIRHYKKVENNEIIKQEMENNPKFREAVRQSRDFYTLRMDCEHAPMKGDYSQLLEKGVRSGQYPCVLMGIHSNVYWYHTILEDNRPGRLCSELVLRPLRAHIYRMVLPRQETEVLEQWTTPQREVEKKIVTVRSREYIPLLDEIRPGNLVDNLRAFHNIMSHFEQGDSPTNWFNRYGHTTGFIVYLLRYFLHLTWGRYIFLTKNEFLALVVLVFGQPDVSHYQATVLRPSVRCVTILNWFQNLYRHAYTMLGSLLHLQQEFPLPSELFSGAVWTALFMASSDDVEAQQGSPDFLRRTQEYIDNILKEEHVKGMTRQIAEGFFDYE